MSNKKVSDIIGLNDIKDWSQGSIITIKAGTGVGKSYFIKNSLYEYAKKNDKKILMLLHRRNCLEQFKNELGKYDKLNVIDLRTYQSIEVIQQGRWEFDFSQYDYIVCDEFHYFLSDASFNKTTDISLNEILKQDSKIRVFMSATGDTMKNYINNIKNLVTIDYSLELSYDFINELTFFNSDNEIYNVIKKSIRNNTKALVFIQSATRAYEVYKQFKPFAMFNCSESDRHYRYVDKDKKFELLRDERFEDNVLITTTSLDAGVNIIDDSLTDIVVDVDDVGSLIQCIGRKRTHYKVDGGWNREKVNIYIKNINNQSLGGKIKHLRQRIEKADYLRSHTDVEYVEKFSRDNDMSNIIYDTIDRNGFIVKKVNDLMYFKTLLDIADIQMMLGSGKYGYINHISWRLGREGDYVITEKIEKEQDVAKVLESMLGKRLLNDDKEVVINAIDYRVNRRQLRSFRKLNYAIENELNLPYIILSKRTNKYSYWIIERVEE